MALTLLVPHEALRGLFAAEGPVRARAPQRGQPKDLENCHALGGRGRRAANTSVDLL